MIAQISNLLSRLSFALTAVGAAALLYMMSLTVLDIIGRSLGLFTIDSGVEQTEVLMVIIGFVGLARSVQFEGNIVVDVATGHLAAHVNRLMDAFWHLVMAAVLTLLAYLVFRNGFALDAAGQRTELLGISPLVGHLIAAFGMIVAAVVAIWVAGGIFARGGRAPDERENDA
ncbi:MAG TPA: TRAP transporter small permease subunit [Pseudolabrys sp.]|nr:TRAP transporter small permease subunit [Pseudolabrys sp.]